MRHVVTREHFEQLAAPLLSRCISITEGVLHSAGYSADMVDTILLAGGSTRMPMVRQALEQTFGKSPATDINPDEAIALGAALTATLELAERSGESDSIDLRTHDVTSHALGMVTYNDGALHNSVIIEKNARIPTERTRNDFTTTHDGQTTLDLWLVQGDAPDPLDCTALGHFEFYGLPAGPAGQCTLSVTYRYTTDGMVEVEAMDANTGRLLPHRMGEGTMRFEDVATNRIPMHIALVMDCSGSMYGSCIEQAKKAAKKFSQRTLSQEGRSISLTAFPGGVQSDITNDLFRLSKAIDSLAPIGSTPMRQGLGDAQRSLAPIPGVKRIYLLLTDGHPDEPEATMQLCRQIRASGARMITVGVGDMIDQGFLKAMASTPADFHFCNDSIELEGEPS